MNRVDRDTNPGVLSSDHCCSWLLDLAKKVVLHWTDDFNDPQHAISADALGRLEASKDSRGRRLKVCPRMIIYLSGY